MSEFQKKVKDIQERLKAHGLVMSRVPENTREFFIKLADAEFAGDYGMLLQFLVSEFQRRAILETLDIKLNYIVSLLENKNEEKPQVKKVRMLDGKEKIVGKGGKENGTDKKS